MRLLNRNVVEVTTYSERSKDIAVKDKEGNTIGYKKKVIRKFIPRKMTFMKSNCLPYEYLTSKYKPSVNKCSIYDAETRENYLIKGSYEEAINFFFDADNKPVTIKGLGK